AAAWRDIDGIVAIWKDPSTDKAFWERVWCNRLVQSASQAFDVLLWESLASPREVKPRAAITVGFDGGLTHDSTGVVATEIETGYQWVAGVWECPPGHDGKDGRPSWQVPVDEVD